MLKLSYDNTTGKSQSSEWKPKTVKEEQKEEAEMGQEVIKEDITAEKKRKSSLWRNRSKRSHIWCDEHPLLNFFHGLHSPLIIQLSLKGMFLDDLKIIMNLDECNCSFLSFLNTYLFIWLHQVLAATHGIFSCDMCTLSYSMWDLVPWPEIKHALCVVNEES